jgi:hypothetical protein
MARLKTVLAVLAGAVGCLAASADRVLAADEGVKTPFEVTAIVELTGGRISGTRQIGVTLRIDRLTPRDEAWRLADLAGVSGQDALRVALQGRSDGLLRLGALDFPLNLAVARRSEKGQSFVLVSSRALRVSEVNQGSESVGYPFGVVVFTLDDLGNGEGLVYPAARISIDTAGGVVIENFQEEPGVLKEVRLKQ